MTFGFPRIGDCNDWYMHAELPALAEQMKREFMEKRLRHEIIMMLPEPEPIRMVFRYDPITGLEYTSGIEPILIYPIDMLPKKVKLDIERVIHHINRGKVLFINSGK